MANIDRKHNEPPREELALPLALGGDRHAPLVSEADSSLAHSAHQPAGPGSLDGGNGERLGDGPSFGALLRALKRRWLLGFGLAGLAACGAVFAVLVLFPAKYTAHVRIHVASRGEIPVFAVPSGEETEFAVYKANMAAMVKGPWVLSAALNQKTTEGRHIKDLVIIRDKGSAALDWLESALKTDFLLGPEILKVSLSADKADEAAALLNAVAKAFVEENEQRESSRRQQRLDQFAAKQRDLESDLADLRKQMRVLEKENKIDDKDARQAQYANGLATVNQYQQSILKNSLDQINVREEIALLKDRLAKINQLPVSDEKLEEGFKASFEVQLVYKQLEEVEIAIRQIRLNVKPDLVENMIRKEARAKEELQKSLKELREQLRPDLQRLARSKLADEMSERLLKLTDSQASLAKQEDILKAERKKVEAEVAKLAPTYQPESPTLVNMRDKVSTKQASLEQVAKTITLMRAEVQTPRVSLMQTASEPSGKDTGRQMKLAGGGALGMFLIALFGVAFVEYRSGRISATEEVTRGLGLGVVGTLPAKPRGALALTSAPTAARDIAWQGRFNEAVDGIRTMLIHAARTENLRVIMVTSAAVGEGKTTLASQLAASLARAWRKTLLLDGDLRRPSAHGLFGAPLAPGFSELLRGEFTLADALKPTSLSRLWLLPAGDWDTHAVQALAQDHVAGLMKELKDQFDFIIIDSAPVLPVADSLLLGQHADGVILSVLRDVSRAPAVLAAQHKLCSLAMRVLGAVVIGAGDDLGQFGYRYAASGRG